MPSLMEMIRQILSPWKVSSCCPYAVCKYFCGRHKVAVETSSNNQGLFEIQTKDNWTTHGYFHLLAVGDKGCAAVVISRCGQVGKGIQVIAFRVVPGTDGGR